MTTLRYTARIISMLPAADLGFSHGSGRQPLAPALEYIVGCAPGVVGAARGMVIYGLEGAAAGAAAGGVVDAVKEHGHMHKQPMLSSVKHGAEAGAGLGAAGGAMVGGVREAWPAIAAYTAFYVIGTLTK